MALVINGRHTHSKVFAIGNFAVRYLMRSEYLLPFMSSNIGKPLTCVYALIFMDLFQRALWCQQTPLVKEIIQILENCWSRLIHTLIQYIRIYSIRLLCPVVSALVSLMSHLKPASLACQLGQLGQVSQFEEDNFAPVKRLTASTISFRYGNGCPGAEVTN